MCPWFSVPGPRSYSLHRFWVVAATIGAIATTVPAHASGPFVPWTQLFETGVAAKSVAVSDLDQDGHLDLITHDGGQYSIVMGSGNGTFGASLDLAVTSSACSEPAIGDLNGDGRPDLSVGDFGSNTVAVLLGNGDGTFGTRTDFATGNTPASVAMGDLNGDGRPDLVVSNAGSSTVSVLLGNGDGTLMAKVDYDAGPEPAQLRLDDFNGDGHLDAAVYSLSSRRVSVLLGSGDGTLGSRAEWTPGDGYNFQEPGQFVTGDFTGDGNADLIVVGPYCNSVLPGRGDGTFDRHTSPSPCGFSGYSLVTSGDLDGDGTLDLVVLQGGGDQPGYSFASLSIISVGHGSTDITRIGDGWFPSRPPLGGAMGDLNGDGIADLAMVRAFGRSAAVMLALDDGTFPQRQEYRYSSTFFHGVPTVMAGGDIDSDGSSDLLVGVLADQQAPRVMVYRSAGSIGQANLSVNPGPLAFGDLSADGIADLVVVSRNYGENRGNAVLGRLDGSFGPPIDFVIPGSTSSATSIAIGDFDRDGRGDLAIANDDIPATLSVLPGNGDGTFGATNLVSSDGPFGAVHAVDLDQDGLLDLVVALGSDVSVLRGRGDGSFDAMTSFPAGGVVSDLVVADFDGDGRLDVAAALEDGISTLAGLGNGALDAPRVEAGRAARAIAAADLDGDGHLDLAVNSTGISIVVGRGDGTFGARMNLGADFGGNEGLAIVGPDPLYRLQLATLGTFDPAVILLAGGVDIPVETLLLVFEAVTTTTGIEVRWRVSSEYLVTTVLERAEREEGPWSVVAGERREVDGLTIAADNAVVPKLVYYYRLVATTENAAPTVFGPVSGAAGGSPGKLSLTVGPNPSQGQARIQFDIPVESRVRLVVLDLQGRVLSTLNDRVLEPGHHQLMWAGPGASRFARAGAYFVRLETPGDVLSRRFVLLQ